MADAPVRTPWHIGLIGIFAVPSNAIGVFGFVMTLAQGAEYQASAGMTPDQIAHYQMPPGWMTAVWAVGVFAAVLASILLLLRKKLALPIFVLSLSAFLVNIPYTYGLTNGGAAMGQQMAITSAAIAGLLVFFGWCSRFMTVRGVLRCEEFRAAALCSGSGREAHPTSSKPAVTSILFASALLRCLPRRSVGGWQPGAQPSIAVRSGQAAACRTTLPCALARG